MKTTRKISAIFLSTTAALSAITAYVCPTVLAKIGEFVAHTSTYACIFWTQEEPKMPKSLMK